MAAKDNNTIIMVPSCYEGVGGNDFLDYLKEETPVVVIKSIKMHKERNVVEGVISYSIANLSKKQKFI